MRYIDSIRIIPDPKKKKFRFDVILVDFEKKVAKKTIILLTGSKVLSSFSRPPCTKEESPE